MTTQLYKQVSGTGKPINGAADVTIIAAQGAGSVIRVQRIAICVTVAAVGGGGEVAIEDGVGGTRFVEIDADAVGCYTIDFGEMGYPLSANTALVATVDGAVTTQASARVTAIGIAS